MTSGTPATRVPPLPTLHAAVGVAPDSTRLVGEVPPPPHDVSPPDLGPPNPPAPTALPPHTRCGWIDDYVAEAAFVTNAAQYDAIHPKWWQLDADGGGLHALSELDLPSIVAAAKANHVRVLPLIDTQSDAGLRALINSPALIQKHAQDLVAIMKQHGYAGVDIDYEHLWSAADRPGYTALMQALSKAFHDAGFELSMALEPIGHDDGNSGYDYAALSQACDTLHMMEYDFHWVGGDHLGPLAPLGWVDASFANAEATGHREKFMIGLANYAIGSNYWTSAKDAASQCVATPATATNEGMTSCPYTHYMDGRSLSCLTAANGVLWFEDVASMEEKVQIAIKHGVRGVTYWTLGDELPGYFAMVKKYFP